MTLDKQFILTDEEIAISFTKGFEECEVPLFKPPSLTREIKLRQKAGDIAVAQAQDKKTRKGIIEEAKKQGVIEFLDGKLFSIRNDKVYKFFESLLKGE